MRVEIPRTLIIATGEFDRFMEASDLPPRLDVSDDELRRAFLSFPLSESLLHVLRSFLEMEEGPLAVRSSALLEDSQSIPFAGVYDTYMLPGDGDSDFRLNRLADAVRLVWASTFSGDARAYRDALGIGGEEEKMAVVIQKVAGARHGHYWFPRLSGTAQSLNYYPVGPMEREDGAARIAVGLGRSVVEGDRGFLFCPRYPTVPWGSEEDRWREGQVHFWALKAALSDSPNLVEGEGSTLDQLAIRRAEDLGILRHMASTWDPVSHRLQDGIDVPGARVVDFRDILEYEWLPLAPLLDRLLRVSRSAMGIPVEMEFALDWQGSSPEDAVFSLLQVRPLISQVGPMASVPDPPDDEHLLIRSNRSLGHGVIDEVYDVIWVDPDRYDPGETETFRDDVALLIDRMAEENRPVVLIGPGRWGSRDRFLGIPVTWAQVRQARLIVEVARGPGDPEPSQGSHFFHNLVALGVGYAHVGHKEASGLVDWDALGGRGGPGPVVRHRRFDRPIKIVMDGKKGFMWVSK
jgi:hypothetical protein